MAKILDSILDAVGSTPMVRLCKIGRETGCEILAKCEYLNPGGSVKDRIGKRMVLEAAKSGRISPGDTLIEPTSGNTGIGMAMAAAVNGYRMVITMPEKMSREKQVVLEALGAEIVRTPTEAAWDAPESHIGVAKQLKEIIPNAHILDQYSNPDNPDAHTEGTAKEILEQTGGQLDYMVMTAGTGGTLTGIARALKAEVPNVKIIGVDPLGSILAGPAEIGSYKVEGIGYDFIPDVLERGLVDEWIKSEDGPSFRMSRRLIRQEGLLVGGSSGSAVWAAKEIAKREGPDKRIVTILPDSVRNYMTKFLDEAWMKENGFAEAGWESTDLGSLLLRMPKRELLTAQSAETLEVVVGRMKENGISQLPVLDDGRLVEGGATLSSAVAEVMFRSVNTVHRDQDAGCLLEIFARNEIGLVVDDSGVLIGLITKMDLVDTLAAKHA